MQTDRRANIFVQQAALLFGGMICSVPIFIVGVESKLDVMEYLAIGFGASCALALVGGILYELLRTFQWRLLELMLTIFGATLSAAYGISVFQLQRTALDSRGVSLILFYLAVGLILTFIGSCLGHRWIQRLKEEHTLIRVALLLLGWATLVSPFVFSFGLGVVVMIFTNGSTLLGSVNRQNWICAAELLSASFLWIPASIVELRARKAVVLDVRMAKKTQPITDKYPVNGSRWDQIKSTRKMNGSEK